MNLEIGSKIGVGTFPYTHVGVYLGGGRIFHNHWSNGMEIISMEVFRGEKSIRILSGGVRDIHLLNRRIATLMKSSKKYHWISFNCEHAASLVC